MLNTSTSRKVSNLRHWRSLFNLTVLGAYFYASMEWLFFATKPSSLSLLSSFDSVKVLFVTAGIIALVSIVCLSFLFLPSFFKGIANGRPGLLNIGYMVPALLISVTALIMLDNFTYTVFK